MGFEDPNKKLDNSQKVLEHSNDEPLAADAVISDLIRDIWGNEPAQPEAPASDEEPAQQPQEPESDNERDNSLPQQENAAEPDLADVPDEEPKVPPETPELTFRLSE